MKAKMPRGQKAPEAGQYECRVCQTRFTYEDGDLICPKCKTGDPQNLIPYYMEDDKDEDQMYSKDDWHGGD